jgi:hypothetical protein
MPPDVWAAFPSHHDDGGCAQLLLSAISLKTPFAGSISEIAIFRQLTLRHTANFPAFIDLPLVWP